MKLTKAQWETIINNNCYYKIEYETKHGKGIIVMDTFFYHERIKKFERLFKDVNITKFIQIPKEMFMKELERDKK